MAAPQQPDPLIPSPYRLRVRTDDGGDYRFWAPESDTARTIDEIARGRVFEAGALLAAGPLDAQVINRAHLTRIDITGDLSAFDLPQLDVGTDEPTMNTEISEGDFMLGRDTMMGTFTHRDDLLAEGAKIRVYAAFRLVGGHESYLKTSMTVPQVIEQRRFLQRMLSLPVWTFRGAHGGLSAISPGKIVHAVFHPGAVPVAGSWISTP